MTTFSNGFFKLKTEKRVKVPTTAGWTNVHTLAVKNIGLVPPVREKTARTV